MSTERKGIWVDLRKFRLKFFALASEWGLLRLFLVWSGFFLLATLISFLPDWRSIAMSSVTGATSVHFLLVVTAANTLSVLVSGMVGASRQNGWWALELRVVHFAAEAGVALSAYGLITESVAMFVYGPFSALSLSVLVLFPIFLTIYNMCLYVMADNFLSRSLESKALVSENDGSMIRFGRIFSGAASVLMLAVVLGSLFWLFPKVLAPVLIDYEESMELRSGEQRG